MKFDPCFSAMELSQLLYRLGKTSPPPLRAALWLAHDLLDQYAEGFEDSLTRPAGLLEELTKLPEGEAVEDADA